MKNRHFTYANEESCRNIPIPVAQHRTRSLLPVQSLLLFLCTAAMLLAALTMSASAKDVDTIMPTASSVSGSTLPVSVRWPATITIPNALKNTMDAATKTVTKEQESLPSVEPAPAPAPAVKRFPYEVPAAENGTKRYMDYRTIKSRSSMQWKLQQSAWTDEYGFRRSGDKYMVAMGTYYSAQCGKTFHITLDNGFEFMALVSDVKQNAHTDAKHQHRNGNVLEFIVDTNKMPRAAKRMGDVSYSFSSMKSTIKSIVEIVG